MPSSPKSTLRKPAIAILAVVALLLPAISAAQAPAKNGTSVPGAEQVERRLQSVKALVENSSAARQIETSGNARAAAQRAEARQLLRLAEEAHAASDERSAASLLDNAARQMLEGARLASGEGARTANLERDVGARIEATQALLAAQKRIASEKKLAGGPEAAQQIERLVGQARDLHAARRYAEAQPVAQQAYLLAKASVGSMRGGDTLVRTLSFTSKEEEYHYEVDRYETHRMLLELLAKKGDDVAASRAGVARATQLRQQADASAARGDHAAGVAALEDATRELVRAIRAAGVFIPG